MAKKPKFRKGQVVRVRRQASENGSLYDQIAEVKPGIGYRLEWWDWTYASSLRPLTAKEIGPRPRRKVKR